LKINSLRVRGKKINIPEKLDAHTASMAKPIDGYSFFWLSIRG